MNLELMSWSEAAGAQVLQVTLVAVVVAILVRIFARSRPHLAYLLWMVVILKCLTPPLAASRTSVFSWVLAERPPVEARVQNPERPKQRKSQSPRERFPLEPMPAMVPLEKEVGSSPVAPATSEVVEPPSFSTEAVLFGLWALGASTLCSYVALKWVRFRIRVRRTAVAAPDWLHDEVGRLSVSLGLRREPRIMLCETPLGPLSMGLLRPTVVLPAALVDQARADALKPILAHELMHLRRGDVALGYGQLLAQILWWFHPLVWWANREARRERERCCDEAVLARFTLSPAKYARTLIDVLDTKHNMQAGTLLPIASASDVNDQRLRHIMRPAATFHRSTPRWCWPAVVVVSALLLPGAGLSLEPETSETIAQAEGDEASISANENSQPSEPAAVLKVDEPESKEPTFSPKHEAAAKRLQELGARYWVNVNSETKLPNVGVVIGQEWKGSLEDWQLLADLDTLFQVYLHVAQDQVNGLDVLAGIDDIYSLKITSPSVEVIKKIGAIPQLTNLTLSGLLEEDIQFKWNDLAPISRIPELRSLSIGNVRLDREAMRAISKSRGLELLSLYDSGVTDDGIAELVGHPALEQVSVREDSPQQDGTATSLSGVGFGALTGLPKLRSLHLAIPTVDDEGLLQISRLQQLDRLHLISLPKVTAEGMQALGDMTKLKELFFNGPNLSGKEFEFLTQLKDLQTLVLGEKSDMDDAGTLYLSELPKLRAITTPGKSLTDAGIESLTELNQLRLLNISEAPISMKALKQIVELPELESWSFDARELDDESIPAIRTLPNTGGMNLRGADITDAGVEALLEGNRYMVLNLSGTLITDRALDAIVPLEGLTELHLANTAITDEGLRKLHRVKGLEVLDVLGTEVSEAGVLELKKEMPRLRLSHDYQPPEGIAYFTAIIPDDVLPFESDDETQSVEATEASESTFSPKHEAAAKRLQELGAEYLANVNTETNLPYVGVSVGKGWKGSLEDWQLLSDLDTLSSINIRIDQEQVSGLDVLTSIDAINTLTISLSTTEVIEKISAIPHLTNLNLTDWRQRKDVVKGRDFALLAKLSSLGSLSVVNVVLDREAMQIIRELDGLASLSLHNTTVTDDGIAQLAGHETLEQISVFEHGGSTSTSVRGVGFGALAGLPKLRWLLLAIPTIDDEGLQQISRLQQVERLNLDSLQNVSPNGIEALGNLKQLRELWIDGPKLTGNDFEFLTQLKYLQMLVLNGESEMGDVGLEYLSGLTKLRFLSMSGQGLTDESLKPLAKLSELRLLNILEAQITVEGLMHLAKLPRLNQLHFDAKKIDDNAIVAIRQLPALEALELPGARITDAGVAALVAGDRFQLLDLSGTPITDQALDAIQSLETLNSLYLRDTAITDVGLKKLHRLKGLKNLNLMGTDVTNAGVDDLRRKLPGLEMLWHPFMNIDEGELTFTAIIPDEVLSSENDDETSQNEQSDDETAKQPEAAPEDREDTDEGVTFPNTGTIIHDQGDELQHGEGAEPSEPKFSSKHEAAVMRLQELGATYSAGVHPQKKIPLVSVYCGDGWKGGQQDLTILEDLDVVSYLYLDLPDQEELNLDVVGNLDQLELLTLVAPTAQRLATIGIPPNLTHLILEGRNERPVELTAEDYAPVGQHSSLTNLMVLGLPVPDGALEHFGKLRNLEGLHLRTSDITDAGLKWLASLENLRQLMIEGSPASDGTPATSVNGTGFASLADLPHLNVLTLVCPELTDEGLAEISKLRSIEQLMLRGVENITPAGISALSGMTWLKKLDLIGSGLEGDDFTFLASMKNLRSLGLFGYLDLGDAGATHIAGLEKLRSVTAPGNGLGDQGFRAIGGLDQLRVLNIPQAQPSPKQLEELLGLHELFELTFDARYFDDACAAKLKELPRLRGLSLQGSPITDEGLAALVRDHQFVFLDLDHTAISDRGLAALANLETLERLRLLHTPITDEGLASLEQVCSLKQLNVAHTKVTEAGVKSFQAAMPGCFFVHDFSPDDSAWDMGWIEASGLYEEILADD